MANALGICSNTKFKWEIVVDSEHCPNLIREHSFFSWGGGGGGWGGPEEFGSGSANFDMLQRGGSFYSFGINGGGHKNNQ